MKRARWRVGAVVALMVMGIVLPARAEKAVFIASAGRHTAVIEADGTLWAVGQNNYGQLGTGMTTGDKVYNGDPARIMDDVQTVACGFYHTLILKNDGTVWACGKNKYGAVGNGTTRDTAYPEQIEISDVRAIAAGDDHNLAIVSDEGIVYSWGRNQEGQLGTGKKGSSVQKKPKAIGLSGAVAVAAGDYCSAALLEDGTVMTWGGGSSGELGNGKKRGSNKPVKVPIEDLVSISVGDRHMAALTSEGDLYAWGLNEWGQCGLPRSKEIVVEPTLIMQGVRYVECGDKHTAAITQEGELYTFGLNEYGQLANGQSGNGDYQNVKKGRSPYASSPAKVMDGAQSVVCAYGHTIVTMEDGRILGYGENVNGQIALARWTQAGQEKGQGALDTSVFTPSTPSGRK